MIRAGKRDAKDPRALRPRDVDGATIQRERFWLLKRHVTTHAPDHLPTRCLVRKAICTRRRVFCGSRPKSRLTASESRRRCFRMSSEEPGALTLGETNDEMEARLGEEISALMQLEKRAAEQAQGGADGTIEASEGAATPRGGRGGALQQAEAFAAQLRQRIAALSGQLSRRERGLERAEARSSRLAAEKDALAAEVERRQAALAKAEGSVRELKQQAALYVTKLQV
eukprot:1194423-Prorocentrum_minimum.AAC.20